MTYFICYIMDVIHYILKKCKRKGNKKEFIIKNFLIY